MKFHRQNGLLVPVGIRDSIRPHGRYHVKHFREGRLIDEFEFDNICVTQGLVQMLNSTFAGASQVTNWYLGVFQNNYTPVPTDTAATIVGNAGEFTGYSGGARPGFTPALATSTASITNSASQATFNFTGTATLYGVMLMSGATPGSNSGLLFSASQFPTPKPVASPDSLSITYTLNATSS